MKSKTVILNIAMTILVITLINLVSAVTLSNNTVIENTCVSTNFTIIAESTVDTLTVNSTCVGDVNNVTDFYIPTYLAIKNTNSSGSGVIQTRGLTNALITISDGTEYNYVTGSQTITLGAGEYAYVYDEYYSGEEICVKLMDVMYAVILFIPLIIIFGVLLIMKSLGIMGSQSGDWDMVKIGLSIVGFCLIIGVGYTILWGLGGC